MPERAAESEKTSTVENSPSDSTTPSKKQQ
jgi:hypothetical protein